MKAKLTFSIILFTLAILAIAKDSDRVKEIRNVMQSDPDFAISLSIDLLKESREDDDLYGLVKANYFLGYLTKDEKEYRKSVIYYLEAIRYAEDAQYEGVEKDRVYLRRNLANTFKSFGAHRLATQFNWEAIRIAEKFEIIDQITDIKFNQALVYTNSESYDSAIFLLKDLLSLIDESNEYIWRINNQIGYCYFSMKSYQKAKNHFTILLKSVEKRHLIYKARGFHSLGHIAKQEGDLKLAEQFLLDALHIKIKNGASNYSLLQSYTALGNLYYEFENYNKGLEYLKEAQELGIISKIKNNDKTILTFYTLLSKGYFKIGNPDLGAFYSDLLNEKTIAYYETQQAIKDDYLNQNLELISRRYYDRVSQEEKIATLITYMKIGLIAFLVMLLCVISYNYYKKVQLRHSLRSKLAELNILD